MKPTTIALHRSLSALFFFFGLLTVAQATHIVGGELTYTYIGDDQYIIALKVYRDCGPDNTNNTGFDEPAYVGIYEQNSLYQTLSISQTDAVITLLPVGVNNPCLVVPPDVCIEECVYNVVVTLPPSATGYDLVYIRCCRSPAIVNLLNPQDQGMTCNTHIPGSSELSGNNSSPKFVQLPPALFCANVSFYMDHSALDLDGDSLSYSICQILHGADFLDPQPLPYASFNPVQVTWMAPWDQNYPIESNPVFAIDPVTGEFTGKPTQTGKWVYGICAEEWRNGVLINTIRRDYMIQILPCQELTNAIVPAEEDCQGLTVQFGNNSQNANAYFWDFGVTGETTDTSSQVMPEYTFPTTGTYDVVMVAEPGGVCADTVEFTIDVYFPIEVTALLEDIWCDDTGLFVNLLGDGSYDSEAEFSWTTTGSCEGAFDEEDPDAFNCSGGETVVFTFSAVDHGCPGSAQVEVDLPPAPLANFNIVTEPCTGMTVEFADASTGALSWSWDFGVAGTGNDTSTESDPSFTYPAAGIYNVILNVTGDSGCGDQITQEVYVYSEDPLVMDWSVTSPLPCGQDSTFVLQFTGSGATDIEWSVDNQDFNGTTVITSVPEEGTYPVTLTIYNSACDDEESVAFTIQLEDAVPALDLQVPNIITPNTDSHNEIFRLFDPNEQVILGPGRSVMDYITGFSLRVYDRWGMLMYETDGKTGWKGETGNQEVADGVYYYVLEYQLLCAIDWTRREGYVHVVPGH